MKNRVTPGALIGLLVAAFLAASLSNAISADTNHPATIAHCITNYPACATNLPATKAEVASTSNATGFFSEVLALPSDRNTSTNRLLDFPPCDDLTNQVPTGGRSTRGGHKMRSR